MSKDSEPKTNTRSRPNVVKWSPWKALARVKNIDPLLHKVVDEALVVNALLWNHSIRPLEAPVDGNPYHVFLMEDQLFKNLEMLPQEQIKVFSQRNYEYLAKAQVYLDNVKAKRQRWLDRKEALIKLDAMRRKQEKKNESRGK